MHAWSDRELGEIVGSLLVAIQLGEVIAVFVFPPPCNLGFPFTPRPSQ